MKKLLLLFLLMALPVCAQVSPQIQGAGAPSNPCYNGGQQYIDQTNHVIYACPSSGANWVNLGGGNMPQANIRSLSSDPATCSTVDINAANNIYYNTTSAVYKYCSATNTWTAFGTGSGSGTVTSIATTSPITGGTITTTGTIACATCAIGPGASTANHVAEFSGTDGVTLKDGGAAGTGTVTSIATTAPLGGGTVTTSGTLTCTTCTTNASALTNNVIVKGAGSQAAQLSSMTDNGTSIATAEWLDNSGGTVTGAACSTFVNGLRTVGTNSGFQAFGGGTIDFCANGTRAFQSNSSNGMAVEAGNMGFFGGKGQHFVTQAANNDTAGVVTLSTGAGTHSFTTAYTSAPVCVCTDQTSAAAVQCSTSTTTLTVAGTGSDAIAYMCLGNPN
jgi:hypothetical protein